MERRHPDPPRATARKPSLSPRSLRAQDRSRGVPSRHGSPAPAPALCHRKTGESSRGMRRSFRTLRSCAIPGVSPRAGMRCPVGALRMPHLPRAPAPPTPAPQHTCSTTIIFPHRQQSTTPIEGQAPNQRSGSGTGPERALEAITKNPSRAARKPLLPQAYLRVQDRSRGAPSRH